MLWPHLDVRSADGWVILERQPKCTIYAPVRDGAEAHTLTPFPFAQSTIAASQASTDSAQKDLFGTMDSPNKTCSTRP